jgi:hypothetical protein
VFTVTCQKNLGSVGRHYFFENFEKGMIYMKFLKKGGGVVEKRGEEETKSMPHAPVLIY